MSLENRINKTLNNLRGFKSRAVSNARKAAYIGLISLALAGSVKSAKVEANNNPNIINPDKNYSWAYDSKDEIKASPELGYVIQTESESDINSLNNMLSSSGDVDIKQIGGNHKNLSIVCDNNPNKTENEKTIKSLKAYNQVRYTAPLFSANGETIAVIPEIVARVKDEADYSRLEELCNSSNLIITKRMDFTNKEYLIEVSGNDANAVFESVNALNNTKFIEWAAPNLAFQPKLCNEQEPGQFIPNDELFPRQWHLNNTGQSGGTPNADINAPEAWELLGGGGDPNITIAVLDTGVDTLHPDLINNLVQGYDFYDNDIFPDPSGNDAHGTAVAGLAAAKGNNGIGIAGVAYDCKIMPIRIASSGNFITYVDMARSIRWAAESGADILNCSWGFPFSMTPIIQSPIKDITALEGIGRKGKGCVVLAASGNKNWNILFPAKYPEVIAVGATDHNDNTWDYNAYGKELELVAPGGSADWNGNLWTTDISGNGGYNNPYQGISPDYTNRFGGTSSACPIASGVAALILSRNPNLTNNEVRRILSRSAKDLGDKGWDEFYGNGRVDTYEAVKMALNPPEPFLFVDDDAINDHLSGNPDVSDPLENGSSEHPFDSIQEAINKATPEDTIIVLPGIYTGIGNRDIDFKRKAITVRSKYGASDCIIDCQKMGRGFDFTYEEKDSIVNGLTIINGVAYTGGGIICSMSNPTIKNCIFTNNSSYWCGGGIYLSEASPTVINCTFSGNSAGRDGGGMATHSKSNPNLINCIFWGDIPREILINFIYDGETPPESVPKGNPKITYSNIQDGWPGEGNIDADPLFADPNNNDYHLKSQAGRWDPKTQSWVKDDVTSPCIDAGNPGSSLENELLSIPNNPDYKVYNSRINMGAYGGTSEASFAPYNWALPADLTNDGIVDFKDFAVFAKYWKKTGNSLPTDLNRDGKVDAADLSYFTGDWLNESKQYNKK